MPNSPTVWLQAARPKTLPAALAPVLLGTACAADAGGFQLLPALLATAFALLVQITCNLANDYGDFKRGADTPERAGPVRVTAAGLASPAAMRRAIALAATTAFASGFGLVFCGHGGWWLIAVGITCLAACLAYTGGPFPLAYHGLGDLFVLIFFGYVAVHFTAFTQCGQFLPTAWLAGSTCGLLAVNILVVNNARDLETDAKANKRTLIVRFGRRFAKCEYLFNTTIALALPATLIINNSTDALALLLVPMCLPAIINTIRFCRLSPSKNTLAAYNPLLAGASLALLAHSASFALWIILH